MPANTLRRCRRYSRSTADVGTVATSMKDPTIITNGDAAARKTRCCIVGGGPAGMMLGVLLARAGIEVIVLEKHRDFLRDFRGDTVHPSTLQILHELGWL